MLTFSPLTIPVLFSLGLASRPSVDFYPLLSISSVDAYRLLFHYRRHRRAGCYCHVIHQSPAVSGTRVATEAPRPLSVLI